MLVIAMADLPAPPRSNSRLRLVSPMLFDQVHAATRKQHAELNACIISCLPLALPPKASDPALLGHGLAAFAQIFNAFESAWDELEADATNREEDEHESQVRTWLASLRPSGLPRSQRLEQDLNYIEARIGHTIDKGSAKLDFLYDIKHLVPVKSHVLVAYAWVFYMAVFSGGRWIRGQLAQAGPEFWIGPSEKARDDVLATSPGFSFLSFDGDKDGEDIKALFKARLVGAETLLTPDERQDIIDSACKIFDDCITLVKYLDQKDPELHSQAPGLPLTLKIVVAMATLAFLWSWVVLFNHII
ncbi:Hypothetical protein R9X50_00251900 [Acrodontium crateriforme]|uniref:Heme oxygenase n=1 Tax=Acrodontium crateriforme TaxID=150365 RepID=A0AAQ3R8L6_9PEZI|nr:Hypothetical protein R9X50_00251900 [Acrodontium crateriforme]